MQPTTETIIVDGEEKEIMRYTITLDDGHEVLCVIEPTAMARFIVGLAQLPIVESDPCARLIATARAKVEEAIRARALREAKKDRQPYCTIDSAPCAPGG